MTTFYDVTLPITDNMIVYPGDQPVHYQRTHTIEKDGYNWSEMSCGTHIGTHVDAPVHFAPNGLDLDVMPYDLMISEATVIETNDEMITASTLAKANINDWRVVLFKTRNQKLWHLKDFSKDYVSLTPDAAELLVKNHTQLVGIDYKSIESFYTHDYPVHKTLLGNNIFIIEGLYLNNVPPGRYKFYCLPMKLAAGDGGPVRVLLENL
jgi:arylformamidase